jgi:hypothetical protein
MNDGEGALAGAPDDLPFSVAPAPDPLRLTAEYRGGPIATARLILDAYIRDDPAWSTIEPSRPDNDPPPNAETKNTGGDE